MMLIKIQEKEAVNLLYPTMVREDSNWTEEAVRSALVKEYELHGVVDKMTMHLMWCHYTIEELTENIGIEQETVDAYCAGEQWAIDAFGEYFVLSLLVVTSEFVLVRQ